MLDHRSVNMNQQDVFDENKTKEEVVKQISELRKNIKRKHRSLKREMIESEELWERQLKPISEPLKQLLDENADHTNTTLKDEIFQEPSNALRKRRADENCDDDISPVKRFIPNALQGVKRKRGALFQSNDDVSNLETPLAKRLTRDREEVMDAEEDGVINEEDEEGEMEVVDVGKDECGIFETPPTGELLLQSPYGKIMAKRFVEKNFTGNLAKEYFIKLIKGSKEVDSTYGVHVSGDHWKIGDKVIELNNNDLLIDGLTYEGTRGLYELIFMNKPNEYVYTEKDLNSYASILAQTNVHRVNYSPRGKIRSNRGHKYKNIISVIFSREKDQQQPSNQMETHASGSGLTLTDSKPNVIYYDDANEIIDRLRILMASQAAGNNAHSNEINAIMEELIELKPELCKQF